MPERSLMFLAVLALSGCVVRYGEGAQDPMDETEAQAASARYDDLSKQIDALVSQTDNVDQRDRLEAAWRMAQSLQANPNESAAAVTEYLEKFVQIEKRQLPTGVEAVEQDGALDSFSPTGQPIQEETIESPDPTP